MCITKTELEQKVQELRSLKAMKEELENEVKAVEHEVILYMTEHNLDSEITDSAKITYKAQNTISIQKLQTVQKLLIKHRAELHWIRIS